MAASCRQGRPLREDRAPQVGVKDYASGVDDAPEAPAESSLEAAATTALAETSGSPPDEIRRRNRPVSGGRRLSPEPGREARQRPPRRVTHHGVHGGEAPEHPFSPSPSCATSITRRFANRGTGAVLNLRGRSSGEREDTVLGEGTTKFVLGAAVGAMGGFAAGPSPPHPPPARPANPPSAGSTSQPASWAERRPRRRQPGLRPRIRLYPHPRATKSTSNTRSKS